MGLLEAFKGVIMTMQDLYGIDVDNAVGNLLEINKKDNQDLHKINDIYASLLATCQTINIYVGSPPICKTEEQECYGIYLNWHNTYLYLHGKDSKLLKAISETPKAAMWICICSNNKCICICIFKVTGFGFWIGLFDDESRAYKFAQDLKDKMKLLTGSEWKLLTGSESDYKEVI